MSQGNVDATRTSIEAYRRGDYARASAHLAPDVVWTVGQELPAHCPAAVRAMWERWDGEWEQLETVIEEVIDAGTPRQLVAEVAELSHSCGVMPVPGAMMRCLVQTGVCLVAIDREGFHDKRSRIGLFSRARTTRVISSARTSSAPDSIPSRT